MILPTSPKLTISRGRITRCMHGETHCPVRGCEPNLFEPAGPYSVKVRCRVCGSRGYDHRNSPWSFHSSWMVPHVRGHKPCRNCGRPLSVLLDGSARVHGRCPRKATAVAS